MNADSIALLLILAGALVLFYTRWIRADLTALMVLLSLLVPWKPTSAGLMPLLTPKEAFSGFGSTAVMMVIAMFAVSAGLGRTGAADLLGKRLFERCGHNEVLLQGVLLSAVALFSSVINDTTAVLVWMPVVVSACNQRRLPASRYLLAVAYGAMLGGQWTLIGTRSNIVVSDLLRDKTDVGLGFFQFTPIAAPIFVACLIFYLTIGRRMLPAASPDKGLAETYRVTEFLTEVMVTPQSTSVGQTLREMNLKESLGVDVIEVIRGKEHRPPSPWLRIEENDVVVVQGESSRIARLLKQPEFQIQEELKVAEGTLRSVDLVMFEALVARNSWLIGRTPGEVNLFSDSGISILAVSREGRPMGQRPTSVPLRFGDTLLLCGHPEGVERLRQSRDLLIVETRPFSPLNPKRAAIMATILGAMILSVATNLLPPAAALPFAAAATILTGCLKMRELYSVIDWMAVVVVGGMLPYGLALEKTGTAARIALAMSNNLGGFSDILVLGALLGVAVIFTQLIEKTAVAIVLAPLYFDIAVTMGLAPAPVLLGLAMVLSTAFMTPIAHEATILVMGPGRYSFGTYLKVGFGFTFLSWLGTTVIVSLLYTLTP